MQVDSSHLQWVGVDLHVHSPASEDYRGNRDDPEYLSIIERANQFGTGLSRSSKPKQSNEPGRAIGCIAITDHNSVEGFRKFRELNQKTRELRDTLRGRDPANAYLKQLEKEVETLSSIRILMGVEIKANPGIHLLIIFQETVEPETVRTFLGEVYGLSYQEFAGKSGPVTCLTLEDTLNKVTSVFGENAFVVAPHIDSSGGVYDGLKEYPQIRMKVMKHPSLKALSFNKIETRERIQVFV